MKKSLTVLSLALSGICFAAQAGAADALLETKQIQVPYSDLNLSHPAGAETMLMRIKSAASQVCGTAGSRDLRERAAIRDCVNKAIDNAVAQLHAPLVTALHTGRPVEQAAQVAGR